MEKEHKRFYFVRHGESIGNASGKSHGVEMDALSPKGKEQALFLAKRLKAIPVLERILCSSMGRARETAIIINQELNLLIEFLDILRETKRPSTLEDLSHNHSNAIHFRNLFDQHKYEENWKFSDEESFSDRKSRGLQVIKYLHSLSEDKVLIVAHNGIIKTIISVMLFGETMTPKEYYSWMEFTKMSNIGITECFWHKEKQKWKLVSWNDLSHLN